MPLPLDLAFRRVALVALFCVAAGQAMAAAPERFVPGTYRQIDTVTKKPLPVGNQIVIISGKSGRLGFSVNAVRQTDANQGFIAGVLPTVLPATWSKTSSSGNCRLIFEGVPHGLRVTQDDSFGDCGFGLGVSASGTYLLVAEKPLKT
jgi:hypothetical protein